MEPMRPVDVRQVRPPRVSAETRVRQAVVLVCAIPFVVLVTVRAPLWVWAIAMVCGLLVIYSTEHVLRRQSLTRRN